MLRPCDSNHCEVSPQHIGKLRPLSHLRIDIERELGVEPPPLLREHPSATLYETAKLLIQTHARRVPLLDNDSETGHEVIVSVLTQYRLLKFISINVRPFYVTTFRCSNMSVSVQGKLHNCICPCENSRLVHMCQTGRRRQKAVLMETLSIPSLPQACPHLSSTSCTCFQSVEFPLCRSLTRTGSW